MIHIYLHHSESLMRIRQLGILFCVCLLLSGCKPWKGEVDKDLYQPKLPDPSLSQEWEESESGLRYRILRKPTRDKKIKLDDAVHMHFKGYFEGGQIFDSTYRNPFFKPSRFEMKKLIKGMQEAIQIAGIGGMVEAEVPPELGYGNKKSGIIPPNTTLFFLIEPTKLDSDVGSREYRLHASEPFPVPEDAPTEYETTPNGVKYKVNIKTNRIAPTLTDGVCLHCRIELENGELYFETYALNEGAYGSMITLPLGIKEAISKCTVNGQVEAIVPSDLLGSRQINWIKNSNVKLDPIPEGMDIKMIIEVFAIQNKDHPHHHPK